MKKTCQLCGGTLTRYDAGYHMSAHVVCVDRFFAKPVAVFKSADDEEKLERTREQMRKQREIFKNK